jgi:hypothetical protein
MDIRLMIAIALLPAFAGAQETSAKGKPIDEAAGKGQSLEAEFVASDVFRSGSLIVPFARKFAFEGHYFGGTPTETETGFTGVSWAFSIKGFKLIPGIGAIFGNNHFTASAAVSFRWEYEKKWFITQGLAIQGLRHTPIFGEEETGHSEVLVNTVRPTISDGSHISARWNRVTLGGTWERIAFREGIEWKGGGRIAIRLLPRISGILYVLTPGRTEWRAGILIHPKN